MLTKVPDPSLGEMTQRTRTTPTGTRASMTDASGTTTTRTTNATACSRRPRRRDADVHLRRDGNVATIRSSNTNGTSVDYAWDAANQLVSVTDNRAGGITTAAYTATGRPATLSLNRTASG